MLIFLLVSSKIQGLNLFYEIFLNLLSWRPTGKLVLTKVREHAMTHVFTGFFGWLYIYHVLCKCYMDTLIIRIKEGGLPLLLGLDSTCAYQCVFWNYKLRIWNHC